MVLSKQDPNYRQCSISVMDNIADPYITFDEKGICNYYYEYLKNEEQNVFNKQHGEEKLQELLTKIKEKGKGKKYDCILGISGGVDSTYLAYKCKEWGLNPLLVHFDNGWNSELAVNNIQNMLDKTGYDLYTYVVDWDEYVSIQRAYFAAHVIDIEAVQDIAFENVLRLVNKKHKIGIVIGGHNIVTEAVLPGAWINKTHDNLANIVEKFSDVKFKSYPYINHMTRYLYDNIYKYEHHYPLNLIDYNKTEAKKTIIEKFGWRDYGGKHYESIFTRFYQGHILPVKFKVDKRKAHLSNLIFSGQMTKEEAMKELELPPYPSEQLLKSDMEFFLKKMNFTKEEFEEYLSKPAIPHEEYGLSVPFFERYKYLIIFKPLSTLIKKIFKSI